MKHDEIIRMAREAAGGILSYDAEGEWRLNESECEMFVQLILQAAIDNLEWHGRDADAITQVKYLKDIR